jgi:hypothetical protein
VLTRAEHARAAAFEALVEAAHDGGDSTAAPCYCGRCSFRIVPGATVYYLGALRLCAWCFHAMRTP